MDCCLETCIFPCYRMSEEDCSPGSCLIASVKIEAAWDEAMMRQMYSKALWIYDLNRIIYFEMISQTLD